jgi:hypothetical protein
LEGRLKDLKGHLNWKGKPPRTILAVLREIDGELTA